MDKRFPRGKHSKNWGGGMAYYVDVMPMALEDAQDALAWMEQHSPKNADEWYAGLLDAIFSLDEMPLQ